MNIKAIPMRIDSELLIESVHALLMAGSARWQIDGELRKRAEDEGVAAPTAADVDAAYAACVERWITDAERPPEEDYAYHIAVRKDLIAKSRGRLDYPTAARIAADLAKLQDQYRNARANAPKASKRASNLDRLRNRKPVLKAVK